MVHIQSRFVNGANLNKWFIDTPNHTTQGFVVDVNFKYFDEIFQHGDHGIIFKNNNFWLFIDNDENQIDGSIVSEVF